MKISTAIRKGSRGREQGQDFYEHNGKVCALGAAILGSGNMIGELSSAPDIFPKLDHLVVTEDGDVETVFRCVTYQNDVLEWSFEEIANWLEYYGY